MEDEWDAKIICVIEEDKLALMKMMGKHIDYRMTGSLIQNAQIT